MRSERVERVDFLRILDGSVQRVRLRAEVRAFSADYIANAAAAGHAELPVRVGNRDVIDVQHRERAVRERKPAPRNAVRSLPRWFGRARTVGDTRQRAVDDDAAEHPAGG